VRGNQHIPTDDIMKAITAKVGEPFTAALAQEQAQKVRALGWFYDVDLTSEPTAQGVQMNVTVVENPVIKGIVIEGNTVYTADQLKAVMQTRPGQVANNDIIRSDLMALQNKYANAGYIFMRITDITTDAKTGNLVITLVEGQVEEVRITGNRKTKRYVVLREMRTRPGGILNADRLRRDLDRLVNLEIFEDVSAQPTVGTAPGKVIVNINVKERKTGLASAGVAYSSVQKFVGFVDYAEANLRGTGQKVSARAEFGGRQSYELGYFAPWIAAPATSMQLNVYARRILREAFTTTNQAFLYDEKRTGGNVTFSRPLGASETTRVYGTLRVDSVSVLQEENQAPLPAIIALQRGEQVRSIGFTVRNDTRNIIANPTHGGVNAFSMEFAGLLLGGANFTKFGLDVRRYFHATGGKRIFAMRFLAGTTTGDPPFLEQYLIGGGETLRGFRNDRFPGEHMLLLNNELRIPLQQSFALVVFADVGDAWGGIFARDLGDTTFKPHLGYGLGVRVVTPIGPIRIDYGISNEGQETHFSVGHAF
jgi:outer membrane protein insertion porin family